MAWQLFVDTLNQSEGTIGSAIIGLKEGIIYSKTKEITFDKIKQKKDTEEETESEMIDEIKTLIKFMEHKEKEELTDGIWVGGEQFKMNSEDKEKKLVLFEKDDKGVVVAMTATVLIISRWEKKEDQPNNLENCKAAVINMAEKFESAGH